jgi:putative Holliday junction resolvase
MSDPLGLTATPFEVVDRRQALERIVSIVEEWGAAQVVVGLPTSLSGEESGSARDARGFGAEIAGASGVDVVFVDERFTSRMAESSLLEAGVKRRNRRATVDKVAAAIILQSYLDGNYDDGHDVEDPGAQ